MTITRIARVNEFRRLQTLQKIEAQDLVIVVVIIVVRNFVIIIVVIRNTRPSNSRGSK